MNNFLHFLLCQSCRSLRNVSLSGRISSSKAWSKALITVGGVWWRH